MKKTNKKIGKYLIAPIVSLFTLVTIGASIGFSSSGSLNTLGNNVNKTKMKSESSSEDKNVSKVEAGFYDTFVISEGSLFGWGRNNKGQLGIGNSISQNKPAYVDVDGDNNPFNDNVTDIQIADEFALAISNGRLYSAGYNSEYYLGRSISGITPNNKFYPVQGVEGQVLNMQVAPKSSMFETTTGLYTFGLNDKGQLGHGNETPLSTPKELTFFKDNNLKIADNTWNKSQSFNKGVLTTSGSLYLWGDNQYGQIGDGGCGEWGDNSLIPLKVNIREKIENFRINKTTVLAVSNIMPYTWGQNWNYSLGIGFYQEEYFQPTPEELFALGGCQFLNLYAGKNNYVIETDMGPVVWGANTKNQTGHEEQDDFAGPEFFSGYPANVRSHGGGGEHSIIATTEGVYLVGSNQYGQLGLDISTDKSEWSKLNYAKYPWTSLDLVEITSLTDTENLKNKKAFDITDRNLSTLLKNNISVFTENSPSNTNFYIDEIEVVESYLDKEKDQFYGMVKISATSSQSVNWLGFQSFPKTLTIKGFEPDLLKSPEISMLDYQDEIGENTTDHISEKFNLTSSVDVEEISKFINFDDFEEQFKIESASNIIHDRTKGTLKFKLNISEYYLTASNGDKQIQTSPKVYDIEINNLAIAQKTIVETNPEHPTNVTAATISEMINQIEGDSKVAILKKLDSFIDLKTYPFDSALKIQNVKLFLTEGKITFDILTNKWYDTSLEKINSEKTFSYTIENLKPFVETKSEYNEYDKDISAQVLYEDVFELETSKEIKFNVEQFKGSIFADYIDISSFPLASNLIIKNSSFTAKPAVVKFDILTDKIYNQYGSVDEGSFTISNYEIKVDNIPNETIAEENSQYNKELTVQETMETLPIGSEYELGDEFILGFVNPKTIPTGAKLTIKSFEPDYFNGVLKINIESDKYFNEERILKRDGKTFTYSFNSFKIPLETVAENNNSYDKSLTVQETMETLPIGSEYELDDEFILGFVNIDTIPTGATLTIKEFSPNYKDGILDVVITTSKHVDSTRYLSDSDKDLTYSFDGFNVLAETVAEENNTYNKELTVQETMETLPIGSEYELDDEFILGFVNPKTIPTGATLTIKSFEPNYLDGTLEVVITTSKHVDSTRYLSDTDKDLTYTFEGFEKTSPTIQKYIDNYDTEHTAQELVEDVLKINKDILGNDKVISAEDLPTHPITQYVDISSFPTNSEFTIQNVEFTAEPAVVNFDIKTDRYYDDKGELKSTGHVIENYTLNMDKIPEQTVVKYNEDVKPFETVQEFEDRIKTSVDESKFNKDMLKDYLNFETFPSQSEIKFINLTSDYKNGSFEITFTSSIWFDENKVKQTESDSIKSPEFVATVSGLLILDETIVKANNAYDKSLTVQETMTVLEGKTFEITDDFIQNFVNVESFPMGAKLTIKSFEPNYKDGKLDVVITTDKFVDENRYLENSDKDLTYSFEGFKIPAETIAEANNAYDKTLTVQETMEILPIGKDFAITDVVIQKFINVETIPTGSTLTIKDLTPNYSEGKLDVVITTNKFIDSNRYLDEKTTKDLIYTFEGFKVPSETITSYISETTSFDSIDFIEYLKISKGEEVSQNSLKSLKEYIDFSSFPKDFKLTTNDIIANEDEGTISIKLETDRWYDQDGFLNNSIPKEFTYTFTTARHPASNIIAKSSSKFPKGLQPNNIEKYLTPIAGGPANLENLEKIVSINSFPPSANFSVTTNQNSASQNNEVELVITASQYYNENGSKVNQPKEFKININIGKVNAPSKIEIKNKLPKELNSENINNYLFKTGSSSDDISVNVNNLNNLISLNEFFPDINNVPELLKDQITTQTQFRIVENFIMTDEKRVSFYLEADQIWNESGFFEKANGSEWFTFFVDFEFPSPNFTLAIVGGAVGGAIAIITGGLVIFNWKRVKRLISRLF
ncbi:MAG: RCC1 domain-containing protein [Mycoplasma sp.]